MRRVVRYKACAGVCMIRVALLFVAEAAHKRHGARISEAPAPGAHAPAGSLSGADLLRGLSDDDVIDAEPADLKRLSSPLATVSPAGVVQALPVDSHSASGGLPHALFLLPPLSS